MDTLTFCYYLAGSLVVGALMVIVGVIVGAWLMFKGKKTSSTDSNEPFIGKSPRGEVFKVPDDLDSIPPFPGAEEPSSEERRILKKNEAFFKIFQGGKE
jgi:hypothetical protein